MIGFSSYFNVKNIIKGCEMEEKVVSLPLDYEVWFSCENQSVSVLYPNENNILDSRYNVIFQNEVKRNIRHTRLRRVNS